MEPADLNSPSRDDARLEALLRRPAAPLPDDGFSARVLAALPPGKSADLAKTLRLRWLIQTWSAVLGVAVAMIGFVLWPGSKAEVADSLQRITLSVARLADPLLAAAIVVAAGCMLFAFWPRLRWHR